MLKKTVEEFDPFDPIYVHTVEHTIIYKHINCSTLYEVLIYISRFGFGRPWEVKKNQHYETM